MGVVIPFNPRDDERRRRMARALLCASRCLNATNEPEAMRDPETARMLERAAIRYVGLFNELSAGRVA